MKDRRCDSHGEFAADGALSGNGPFISMKHSDKLRTFSVARGLQTPGSARYVGHTVAHSLRANVNHNSKSNRENHQQRSGQQQ